jgi:hypothetical protein
MALFISQSFAVRILSISLTLFLLSSANGSPISSLPVSHIPDERVHQLQVMQSRASLPVNSTIAGYVELTCIYQVSGYYTKFQRILFYLVLVFTYCCRFHEWLWTAGMAYIITTAGTAGLHGILLVAGVRDAGPDPDLCIATQLLLVTSIASAIFWMHAPRIFKHETGPLLASWGLFTTIGTVVMQVGRPRYQQILNETIHAQVCLEGLCKDYCNANVRPALFRSHDTRLSWKLSEFTPYMFNNTNTSIGSVSTNMTINDSSGAPHVVDMAQTELVLDPRRVVFFSILGVALSATIINLRMKPAISRNLIVRHLTSKHIGLPYGHSKFQRFCACTILILHYFWEVLAFIAAPLLLLEYLALQTTKKLWPNGTLQNHTFKGIQRRPTLSKPRKTFAVLVGLLWYAWSLLAYLSWPVFLAYTIVYGEYLISVQDFPESEFMDAVGQWSSWVIVIVTLIVALGTHIYNRKHNDSETEKEDDVVPALYANTPPKWLLGWHQGWYCLQLVQREWKELYIWWCDPIEQSWRKEIEMVSIEGSEEEDDDDDDDDDLIKSQGQNDRASLLTVDEETNISAHQDESLIHRATM